MDLIQWILHDGYFSQYELMTVIPSPKHQAQCGYNDGEGDRMDRMKDFLVSAPAKNGKLRWAHRPRTVSFGWLSTMCTLW